MGPLHSVQGGPGPLPRRPLYQHSPRPCPEHAALASQVHACSPFGLSAPGRSFLELTCLSLSLPRCLQRSLAHNRTPRSPCEESQRDELRERRAWGRRPDFRGPERGNVSCPRDRRGQRRAQFLLGLTSAASPHGTALKGGAGQPCFPRHLPGSASSQTPVDNGPQRNTVKRSEVSLPLDFQSLFCPRVHVILREGHSQYPPHI